MRLDETFCERMDTKHHTGGTRDVIGGWRDYRKRKDFAGQCRVIAQALSSDQDPLIESCTCGHKTRLL